ncbi:MAG: adenosylcobalamin-dependent ribonucleoside-diphosphate reductase [Eubacteriales bacterium]|jgi:ribonucleoside-diphosphate reductase alpha chain
MGSQNDENALMNTIWERKYRYNGESYDEWLDRVSGKNPKVRELIKDHKALFGGRTLANRNTGKKATYSNCYSLGFIGDSLDEIMQANTDIARTFKAQGGQGLSLSHIRPKGSPIQNGQFYSDGILPFMKIFNQTTASISQGGARKGALIMTLNAKHKEVDTFIHCKANDDQITKANLSLELDDDFMRAAEEGKALEVKDKWGDYTIEPREILRSAAENAWDWGEPGCIFTNRFRNYNIMEKDPAYQIESCNPCGEQPLPAGGACNLASINLSAYVVNPFEKDAYLNMSKEDGVLAAVDTMVEALDEVLDENLANHPLEKQREMARDYRNVGLGIMGMGDMLIMLGLTYGSKASLKFMDDTMNQIYRQAVLTSNRLAKEKGKFPKYTEAVWDSEIMRSHFSDEEISELKKDGIRNCSLLSIAPSGSIATMLNISTGSEPNFAFHYMRKTESLNGDVPTYYKVYTGIAEKYMKHIGAGKKENVKNPELPDCFVAAGDIPWKQRVDMQAVLQKHVDTGISSTVNLPENATVEDVMNLFIYAWKKGCKGITVFRDNCRRIGILTKDEPKKQSSGNEAADKKGAEAPADAAGDRKAEGAAADVPKGPKRGEILPPDDSCIGLKRTITTGCGTLHIEAFFRPEDGSLYETYFSKGSTGGCNSFMTGLSRMVSLAARGGVPFEKIIDQLQSTIPCVSYVSRHVTKGDTSRGTCCPSAIAFALTDMHNQIIRMLKFSPDIADEANVETEDSGTRRACPDCGNEDLVYTNGCIICPKCGWSRCD